MWTSVRGWIELNDDQRITLLKELYAEKPDAKSDQGLVTPGAKRMAVR